MKTKWYRMIGLVLVATYLGLAIQSPAKKPVKHPPEPEPELPFTYERFVIQDDTGEGLQLWATSINDFGDVFGGYSISQGTWYGNRFAFRLTPDFSRGADAYLASEQVTLAVNIFTMVVDNMINNNNHVLGDRVFDDITSNEVLQAVLWDSDGMEFPLWSSLESEQSIAVSLNDTGLVMIHVDANLYAVIPIDMDGDGNGDVWFVDNDTDGINDLAFPVNDTGLDFEALNESGQVLFQEGYLLTPDFSILEGGGNPWLDGGATLEVLSPLPGFEETYTRARDINDLGQIVGTSNGRAVIWEDLNNPIDLGQPSRRAAEIKAEHINNAGQIIGWCKDGSKKRINFIIHEGQMYDLAELGAPYYPIDLNNTGSFVTSGGSIYIPVYPEP